MRWFVFRSLLLLIPESGCQVGEALARNQGDQAGGGGDRDFSGGTEEKFVSQCRGKTDSNS